MLESTFKTKLIEKIKKRFPGAMVIHVVDHQGYPDLLVLYNDRWAALEGKRNKNASHRPNQNYYVKRMNEMSFARFVYPENEEEVLNELQSAFEF